MKFIRFGDSLLNLEQVICFLTTGTIVHAICNETELNDGAASLNESHQTYAEAQARFQALSDMLIGPQPEPVSKGRVMTAIEAALLPDIIGKSVFLKEKFGPILRVKIRGLTDPCFEFEGVSMGIDPKEEIEVLD